MSFPIECSMAQAISHWRQPMQRSGLTNTLRMSTSPSHTLRQQGLFVYVCIVQIGRRPRQRHWSPLAPPGVPWSLLRAARTRPRTAVAQGPPQTFSAATPTSRADRRGV